MASWRWHGIDKGLSKICPNAILQDNLLLQNCSSFWANSKMVSEMVCNCRLSWQNYCWSSCIWQLLCWIWGAAQDCATLLTTTRRQGWHMRLPNTTATAFCAPAWPQTCGNDVKNVQPTFHKATYFCVWEWRNVVLRVDSLQPWSMQTCIRCTADQRWDLRCWSP